MINNFYNLDGKEDYIMMKDNFDKTIEIRMISEKHDLVAYKNISIEQAKQYRDYLNNMIEKYES